MAKGVEDFQYGHDAIATVDGRNVAFRHGIGHRVCFGRDRIHTVTWLADQPSVEAAEADDYARTGALVSLIKIGMRDVRDHGALPAGYETFEVVRHRDEIDGPFARVGLAVKIATGDLEAWALHAALRARSRGRI